MLLSNFQLQLQSWLFQWELNLMLVRKREVWNDTSMASTFTWKHYFAFVKEKLLWIIREIVFLCLKIIWKSYEISCYCLTKFQVEFINIYFYVFSSHTSCIFVLTLKKLYPYTPIIVLDFSSIYILMVLWELQCFH